MLRNVFSENLVAYEEMWKKCGAAGLVTDDNIIWRMYIS